MARVCEICGKGTQVGNSVETRGKAKYLGGVGTKVTGITPSEVQTESAAGEDHHQPTARIGQRAFVPSVCAAAAYSAWFASDRSTCRARRRRRPRRESHAQRRREGLAAGSSSAESGGSGSDDASNSARSCSTCSSWESWIRMVSSRWLMPWTCPTYLRTTSCSRASIASRRWPMRRNGMTSVIAYRLFWVTTRSR